MESNSFNSNCLQTQNYTQAKDLLHEESSGNYYSSCVLHQILSGDEVPVRSYLLRYGAVC